MTTHMTAQAAAKAIRDAFYDWSSDQTDQRESDDVAGEWVEKHWPAGGAVTVTRDDILSADAMLGDVMRSGTKMSGWWGGV